MTVISPWSKGGWVSSEVFDHTSLIQFVEQRFAGQYPGLVEANITPWRRAVTGDLTAAFDFRSPNAKVVSLPPTTSYEPPDRDTHPDYVPALPAIQGVPKQEPGVRPARAVPYDLNVAADVSGGAGQLRVRFANAGRLAAVFQVRSGNGAGGPWTYTVSARAHVTETWDVRVSGQD